LTADHGAAGVELFVYGRSALDPSAPQPHKFPARQTLEASVAIGRRHRLNPAATLLAQQNPQVIDAGVFHNDVIAVGNLNVLLCHQRAFADRQGTLAALRQAFAATAHKELTVIEASDEELSVDEAVRTYLFNSQLV